jgi:hypothetical protein
MLTGPTSLDEIKDTRWLYSTNEQHPNQVDEVFAILKDGGELVIDGLIWGFEQGDLDMKLLCLQLLQNFYNDAKRVLSAVRALISDEDRLVRVTATNTVHLMADTSDHLLPLLTPRLDSEDNFERILSAANLWRICRSENAYLALRREAARGEDDPMAKMARGCLEEVER